LLASLGERGEAAVARSVAGPAVGVPFDPFESTLTRDRGSCARATFDPVAIDATAAADRRRNANAGLRGATMESP
jgi:hypothetical protein